MDSVFAQVRDDSVVPGEVPGDGGRVIRMRRRHLHAWNVVAVEHDSFGAVRMCQCACGAARYDDRAIA